MRLTFLTVCMIVLYNGFPGAARAQDYPWCVATHDQSHCDFTTYEQCQATASGWGGCYRNKRTLWGDGALPSPSSTRRPWNGNQLPVASRTGPQWQAAPAPRTAPAPTTPPAARTGRTGGGEAAHHQHRHHHRRQALEIRHRTLRGLGAIAWALDRVENPWSGPIPTRSATAR